MAQVRTCPSRGALPSSKESQIGHTPNGRQCVLHIVGFQCLVIRIRFHDSSFQRQLANLDLEQSLRHQA